MPPFSRKDGEKKETDEEGYMALWRLLELLALDEWHWSSPITEAEVRLIVMCDTKARYDLVDVSCPECDNLKSGHLAHECPKCGGTGIE